MLNRGLLVRMFLTGTLLLAASSAEAAVLTWDPAGNGSGSGGAGTWNTNSWWTSTNDVGWTTNDAVFQGTGGAVTLTAPVTATNLTFNAAGYSVSGNTLTLGGAAPTVTMNATSGSISSVLAGAGGLTVAGTGTLALNANAAYSGPTAINSGTLKLQNSYVLPAGTAAFYQFNNPANLGQDSGPNGNNLLTASGSPAFSSGGKFGGALYLNGASTLGDSSSFPTGVPQSGSSYTIALWEKNNGSVNTGGFVGWGNAGANLGNNFRFNGANQLDNYWYGNDWTVSGLSTNPMDGNWHFVAVTWDSTSHLQTMYVDGTQVGQVAPLA